MSELQQDFQATVDDIAQDARELQRIEEAKAKVDPADPEAKSLSSRAEELAEELHRKTLVQQDLTEIAAER